MRALALAVALALPGGAMAHDPTTDVVYDPGYAWFVGPGAASGSDGRIRIVTQPGHGRAALPLDRVDAYQRAYRRHLAHFGMRLPIRQAEARARHAAWHETIDTGPLETARNLDLRPLVPGALPILPGR